MFDMYDENIILKNSYWSGSNLGLGITWELILKFSLQVMWCFGVIVICMALNMIQILICMRHKSQYSESSNSG